MHDGYYQTLDDVVWHYNVGGSASGTDRSRTDEPDPNAPAPAVGRGPSVTPDAGGPSVKPLALSDSETSGIVEFLKTLTSAPIALPDAGFDAGRRRREGGRRQHHRRRRLSVMRARGWLSTLLLTLASAVARADAETPARWDPRPRPAAATTTRSPTTSRAGDMQAQIEDLRERMLDLEQRLDQTRQVATARRPIVSVGGYVDSASSRRREPASASCRTRARWPIGPIRSSRTGTAGCSWATSWRPR